MKTKTVTLDKLSLRNFKGMTYDLVLNGRSADIYGQNKTGKTTTADALCFLITGKNSRGQAKFDIKTNLPDGTPESRLEHEVSGALDDNGIKVDLRCVFHEVWKKVRGSVTQEMSGNTTDYYIDGVNVSETVYRSKIAEIFGDAQTFSLASNPMYFIDLAAEKWESARALVMKHFSTLTDDQVFDSSPDLAELKPILTEKRRTAESHKTVVMAEQKRLNDQISSIPIRIDEVRRSLPDLTGISAQNIVDAEVTRLDTAVNDAKLKLQGVDTGGSIAELSRQLELVNADKKKLETFHYTETMRTANAIDQQRSEASHRISGNKRSVTGILGDINAKSTKISNIDLELDRLRAQWATVEARVFQDTTLEACASCGQSLPADKVQEVRGKALAAFNSDKATLIGDIERRGQQLNTEKTTLQDAITAITAERESHLASTQEDESLLEKLTVQFEGTKLFATEYPKVPGWQELSGQADVLQKSIDTEKQGTAHDSEATKAEIAGLQVQLTAAKANADKFVKRESGENRIETLKAEEKTLAAEFERLEKQKYLCEKFIQEQARQMSDEINGHFRLAKFVMFETQINGGIKPTCLITEGGNIAGRGLNTGTTINVGVDICQAFSQAFGIRPPIVIDNAESVTSWVDTDQQIIRFHAKEEEPTLRVETARQLVAA